MAANLRAVPQVMPPQQRSAPSQQGWIWNGSNWVWDSDCCDPCQGFQPPFPCPPSGFPTPCPPWFPPPAGQAPWYPGANGGVSFSATPPANPIRGNFWWDGATLHLFDGAAWVDIGPSAGAAGGAFVGVNPPANPASGALWWNGTIFQVWDGAKWQAVGPAPASAVAGKTAVTFSIQQSAALTVTPSTWVPIPFSATPMVDTQSAWNTSNFRLTPKVSGLYLIEMRILSLGTAGGVAIVKNDPGTFSTTDPTQTIIDLSSIGAAAWMTAMGVVQMNGTTDFVRAWGFEQSGTFPASGGTPAFGAVLLP